MTHQHLPPMPDPGRPGPAPVKHRWVPWVAYPATLIVGFVVGVASAPPPADGDTPAAPAVTVSTPAPTASTRPPEPAASSEPAYGTPIALDFKLTVKVLTKSCFGSAGCNLTYRIDVSYDGPTLDPSKTYEVLYEVRGGEYGTEAKRFTVTGTEFFGANEEYASTKTRKTTLKAVVTQVVLA